MKISLPAGIAIICFSFYFTGTRQQRRLFEGSLWLPPLIVFQVQIFFLPRLAWW